MPQEILGPAPGMGTTEPNGQGAMAPETLSLRERKYAQTKRALLQAALDRLEERPLDQLSVRELCAAAQVSEATFFNYFHSKTDLLHYFGQLWALEATWQLGPASEHEGGLAAIHNLFDLAARHMQEHPGVWGEIIALQARTRGRPTLPPLTRAECQLAFPKREGIGELPAKGLEALLMPRLEHAVRAGELPPNTLLPTTLVALLAIFFGVPLSLRASNPKAIGHHYRQELAILWAGLRAVAHPTH